MPSVFTHFLILEKALSELSGNEKSALIAHPEYGYFGSIGPDFFYFFEQDWAGLGDLAQFTFELYDQLEEVLGIYNTAQAFRDEVEDWITGGLSGKMNELSDRVAVLQRAFVAKFITGQVDFFEKFTPPISANPTTGSVPKWWLADLAHQRKTVDFAKTLWRESTGKPQLRAYAVGYLTHVGADMSGHPLVNLFVGGAYRTQWRRHGLIEKAQDSHFWYQMKGQRLSNSSAHKLIEMQPPSQTGRLPDMPPDLIKMIKTAINENYAEFNLVNGVPDEDQINNMYRLYYRYLRSSSSLGGINMPPPEDFDWFDLPDFIREELEDTWDLRPTGGLPPVRNILNPKEWKGLLSALIGSARWLATVVIKISTLPVAVISRLTTAPARYLIWLMEQAIYDMYEDLRLALALAGYIHPEHEQVNRRLSEIVRPTDWNTYLEAYGFEHYTNPEQTYHLVHPNHFTTSVNTEEPKVRPIPKLPPDILSLISARTPASGEEFVTRMMFDTSLTSGITELFESGDHFNPDPAGVPTTGPNLNNKLMPSATATAVELIRRFSVDGGVGIKNVNLDGDRGYIWPTWDTDLLPSSWQTISDFRLRDW